MGKERGQSSLEYLMIIGIGGMVTVVALFTLLNPFQSARKEVGKHTVETSCQIKTGIEQYVGEEEYSGSWGTAPEEMIDKSGDKTFSRTGNRTEEELPTGENGIGSCGYSSELKGSCKLNGYNLSIVNHPCGYGSEEYKDALYLSKDQGWVNYTRIT